MFDVADASPKQSDSNRYQALYSPVEKLVMELEVFKLELDYKGESIVFPWES